MSKVPMDAPPPYAPPPPGMIISETHPGMQTTRIISTGTSVQVVQTPSAVYGAAPTITTGSTFVVQPAFGPYPMQVTCPNCNATMMTETSATPGLLTYLLSGGLLLVGCWLGCCLIPCCIPECQDIDHRCANCKMYLGGYRRI